MRFLARKWKAAERVCRTEGLSVLLWELFYQCLKPFLRVYARLLWEWYRSRGHYSFSVQGHQLTVLPKDEGISQELAVYRVHEPLATSLMQRVLKPGMNVVDIGSNIGYYALLEARLVGATGKVIAIEPVSENSEQLSRNVKANGYHNISIHKVAIGDRNGIAPLYVSKKSNWHSLYPVPSSTRETNVRVTTLDSLLAPLGLPTVDMVRMDLEGYEVVVFRGMVQTLENYSPRVLLELHPHLIGREATVDFLRYLKARDYTPEWLVEQERDTPVRWAFLNAEMTTLDELMMDSRITDAPRAITMLLAHEAAADTSGELLVATGCGSPESAPGISLL
jgi:FkbM family methyltransferase